MARRIVGATSPERKRRLKLLPLLLLIGAIMMIGTSQATGSHSFGTVVLDDGQANDNPGQKDLNLHQFDDSHLADANPSVFVRWNWDDLGTSGNNTLDACALLDSDGDGFINFALCAITTGNPATLSTVVAWQCTDTRVDRCASPNAIIPNPTSTCTITSPSQTDPWNGDTKKTRGDSYPNDTRAQCQVFLADFTIGGVTVNDLDLVNTCSYPSGQPNSDPSDCVLTPRDALLKIVKDAGGDTVTEFDFEVKVNTLLADPEVVSRKVAGGGETTVGVIGGRPNSVEELALPMGWEFESVECKTQAGATVGTVDGQKVTGVTAATGTTTTCTFVNVLAKNEPGLTTAPSVLPQDTASLTIDEDGDGSGDLIFELYDNAECTGTPVYDETIEDISISDDYTTDNDSYSINADGTFYWKVHYEGDDRNEAATSDCVESIDVTLVGDDG